MNAGLYAGFDLGGTQLKYGLIDEKGSIVFKDKESSPDSIEGLFELLEKLWKKMDSDAPDRIQAAGFGFAGFFSLKEQKILDSPNYPSLNNVDLAPALRKFLPVPFGIGNDANMAAYGEWKYGAGRDAQSLVLLTIGTGVGSGIVLDGKLWQGRCGFAGEIGHITVNPEGVRCNCGNVGCLETEVSAPKIVRNYVALSSGNESSQGTLTAEEIYKRAERGDAAARKSYALCAHYLGIGLGIIINFLNPEKIVLGGGVMTTGELLMNPAVEEAQKRSHRVSFQCTTILKAALGNDAGMIGSASWARTPAAAQGRRP